MRDEVDEAVEELRQQRVEMESDREFFLTRITGPIDALSEIAGKPKPDARSLIEERRQAKSAPRPAVEEDV